MSLFAASDLTALWAQFVALVSTIVLLFGLSKVPFCKTLWSRNVTDPFAGWLKGLFEPTRRELAAVNRKLDSLAKFVDYQFTPNGGNSARDQLDILVDYQNEEA